MSWEIFNKISPTTPILFGIECYTIQKGSGLNLNLPTKDSVCPVQIVIWTSKTEILGTLEHLLFYLIVFKFMFIHNNEET